MEQGHYINSETFKDFCTNQKELIHILNHRMTTLDMSVLKIKTDINWLKRSLWVIIGLLATFLFASLFRPLLGV